MDKLLVTAIFDIKKRDVDNPRWREVLIYIRLFDYFEEIGLPAILFIEEELIKYIKPRDNLIIIPIKLEDLPAFKLMHEKKLTPVSNGPHLNIYFTAVINSKVYLLDKAHSFIRTNSQFDGVKHLIWLDAGIAHMGATSPDIFKEDIKVHCHDKVMNVLMSVVLKHQVSNLKDFLGTSRGNIAAGIFVVPRDKINWYHTEYSTVLEHSVNELNLMCYEEQIMAVVVGKFPDMFSFSYSDYSVLRNLRYITTDMNTVLRNLIYCREHHLIDMGMDILNKILISVGKAKNEISYDQMYEVLYNGQIISFYKDKELSRLLGFLLAYLYHYLGGNKDYINNKLENIKQNLAFVSLDLLDKNAYTHEKMLQMDTNGILWRVIFR